MQGGSPPISQAAYLCPETFGKKMKRPCLAVFGWGGSLHKTDGGGKSAKTAFLK